MSKYVGIPFEYNGRTSEGIDCLGLVKYYLNDHGIDMPGSDGKPITQDWHKSDSDRLLRGLKEYFEQIDKRPEKFDVLLFNIKDKPRHLGVMVSRNRFLHIRQGKRSTIERLSKWKDYLVSTFRPEEKWET